MSEWIKSKMYLGLMVNKKTGDYWYVTDRRKGSA